MNILFLGISASIKGPRDGITYPFIVKEMKALTERGVAVYFLSGKIPKHKSIEGVTYLSMDEILERNVVSRAIGSTVFFLRHFRQLAPLAFCSYRKTKNVIAAERCIAKAINEFSVDIVHTHFLWPSGEGGVLSSERYNIPVIATLRGAELADHPEFDYGSMTHDFNKRSAKVCLPRIAHFTAPNEYLTRKLNSDFNVPVNIVSRLPNGIENIRFRRFPLNSDKMMLVSIGRVIKLKNYDLILSVAELLRDSAVEFIIVGEGKLFNSLQTKITQKNLHNVELRREVPKEKLYDLIAKADCFLHPSLYEGMPNVVLEALTLGKPCLVSDIPVHRELIEDGVNGWIFDPYSVVELNRRIEWLLENRTVLEKMEGECRKSVADLGLDKKIDGYVNIYRKALSRQSTADRTGKRFN